MVACLEEIQSAELEIANFYWISFLDSYLLTKQRFIRNSVLALACNYGDSYFLSDS